MVEPWEPTVPARERQVKTSRPVLLGGVLVIVALVFAYLLLSDQDPTDTALTPETTESGPADSAGTGGITPSGGQATAPAGGSGGTGHASTAATGTTPAATPPGDDAPAGGSGGTGHASTAATGTTPTATPPGDDAPAGGSGGTGHASTADAGTGTSAATTPPAGTAAPAGTDDGERKTAAAATSQGHDVDTAPDKAVAGTGTVGDTRAVATPGTGGQDAQVAATDSSVPVPADSTMRDAARAGDASSPVAVPVFRHPPAVPIPKLSPGSSTRSARSGTVPGSTAPAGSAAAPSASADTGASAVASVPGDTARTGPDATAPAASTNPDRDSTRVGAGQTAAAPGSGPTDGAPAASVDAGDQETKIDIVRVDPQGNTVIAGRARPRSQIEVGDGTGLVGNTRANDAGEWVIVTKPIEPGNTILTLRETNEDGNVRESRDAIIIGITPPVADGKDTAPLVAVVPRAGDPALARPTRVIQAPQPADPDAAGDDVRQAAEGSGTTDGTPSVTIDTVDYDEDGNVVLGGRADPDATVQVYVDNKLSGTGTASDAGEWVHRSPQPISPGTHELRVDQVTTSGAVVHRIVLPFVRAEPFRSLPGQRVVIIQPGNNLWTIAYRVYGTGTRYTTIYQANADQIRDPDLIYPGQIFGLPRVEL